MMTLQSNIYDLESDLARYTTRAGDLTRAWPKVGQWWRVREHTVFQTHNRGQWPMRAKSTEVRGHGLLIRTGALQRSVSNAKPFLSTPMSAQFGQNPAHRGAWYGRFHQMGASQPLRMVVPPITNTEGEEIVEIIGTHIFGSK